MRIVAMFAVAGVLAAGTASAQRYDTYDRYDYGYAPPSVSNNCEKIKGEQRLAGALVGGVLGGVAGGAIGNNIDDDDHYYRHGRYHRGYRGYHRRGYHRRGHYHGGDGDNSGEVVAGAVIGAIVGGIAGAAIADDGVDCRPQVYDGVPPPTRQPYGVGWEERPRPISHDPHAGDLYGGPRERGYDDYAERTRYEPREQGRECRTVTRITTLPNGEQLREDTQACRDTPYDDWAVQ